jgi:hypothetical protein
MQLYIPSAMESHLHQILIVTDVQVFKCSESDLNVAYVQKREGSLENLKTLNGFTLFVSTFSQRFTPRIRYSLPELWTLIPIKQMESLIKIDMDYNAQFVE